MHEMSLMLSVLDILQNAAREQHFSRIKTVRLEVGALAGAEAGALSFCFDAIAKGSIAEGATLEIIPVPGTGICPQCHGTVELLARFDACPSCGGFPVRVTGGEELRVKDLEVES